MSDTGEGWIHRRGQRPDEPKLSSLLRRQQEGHSGLPETEYTTEDGKRLVLSEIFEEEPVPLTVFVQDKRFLANPPLSPVQYDAVRHAEQIYYQDLYPLMAQEFGDYWTPVRFVNLMTLEWGKGSGKDHICRIASMRVAYLLLCLRSPQIYYGMPEQDNIHMLNIASSSNQAQRAFFKPITKAVARPGNWFADKAEPGMNVVVYDKNIEAISGHSESESQEGLNLMLAVADEIDAFKSKEEIERYRGRGVREPTKSAEAILDMMKTSASTRFPECYKNLRISYPRYQGSTIQTLRRKAYADIDKKGENSRHYVSGPLCTWEVNPRVKGKEAFADDYEEDPVLARAKYECQPARSVNPFFSNEVVIDDMFIESDQPEPVLVDYVWNPSKLRGQDRGAWDVKFIIDSMQIYPIRGARYAMHGDIGIRKDRAGIAMAHVARWDEVEELIMDEEEGEHFRRLSKPVVKVDFVTSFEALANAQPHPREVQIRWYRELATELTRRGFPIIRYTFDGYQSTDAMQILESRGVEAERVSMDTTTAHWDNLKDMASEGRVYAPYRATCKSELLALSRQPNGKIDHPPGGSKDEADALCGAVEGALEVGGSEESEAPQAYPATNVPELIYSGPGLPEGFEDVSLRFTH